MAETEPAVTIPEVEAPTFDPITIDLKIPGLGASISSERKAALSAGADLSEDFMPLPQVIEHHTKKLGITESQLREAAGAQGFDLDYFVGEIGKKGRSTGGVLRELEAQKTPALTTSPEGRKTEARGLQIAKYGYGRAEKGEGRTVEETGVVAEELKDLVRGRDLTYRFLDYDDDIEGVDTVVKQGSTQFEDVVQTVGQLTDESTEVGRMRAELVGQWGQNFALESGLQKYVDPMSAYYTERQAQKRGLSEFDPEYDKLYHRSRARALREVALMKTSGKWVAPTWMSWEKIFPDDRVSQSDDPWLKKAWDRGSRVRVELVGTDNRGAPVFQLTNPVWHIFEMSDVVQSAIAGSLTAAGDEDDPRGIMDRLSGGALEGIENRQTFMDAALATDMARDSTAAAYVLGTVGFAATILTPDLLFGVGTVGRATKKTYRAISNVAKLNSKARVAVPGMKAAALKRAQAEEVLAQAEAAFTAGRLDEAKRFLEESLPLFEEAEKAERNVRKVGPALMDQVDTMDATLYTKAKELTPEITPEGGRKVGDIIGGRFGHLDEAVHPSVRRRAERVRQGGKSLTPYNEYYDTSRIVRGLITAVDDIGTGTFRHTRDVLKKTAYLRSKAYTILKKRGLNRGAIADDPDTMKLWSEFHDYIDDAANVPLMLSKPDQWVAEASKRFSKLINEAAEAAPGGRTLAVETMGQELEVAAAVAGRIKAAQIDNKGRLLSSLAGAVRSVRANTETRAVALLFIRQQVAKAALIPTKPVMVKAATKFEEFRTLTPMARRYLKQIRKVFHNITEAQAQAAARMMDMRAHSAARASDSTVEAWYQSHFPKEAFKSKEEFLARWTAATESQTQEGLEVPAELVKELKNATKAVEKAEKALKKAQDAIGDAAAIKDSKAVVAAEKVFDEAKAAKDAADEALAAATRAQMATAQAAADARTALKNARRGTVEEVIEESAAAPKAAPSALPAQAAVKPDTKAIKAAEEKLAAAQKELDEAITSAPKSIDTADKELLKLQDDLSRGSETALPEIVSHLGPGWTRMDTSTGQVANHFGGVMDEGFVIFKNASGDALMFTNASRLPAAIAPSPGVLTRDATSIASGKLVPGLMDKTALEISMDVAAIGKRAVLTGSAKSIDDAAVKAAQAELDALKAVAPKAAPAAAPKVEAPPAAAARKTVRRKVAADPQVVTAAQKTFDDANEVKKAATKAKSQATKDVKKAAKQRDKAQVALETATAAAPKAKKADTIALLGAHEKLVKAKTRLEAAESTAAKFLDDAQDVAISDAIDFTTTAVLNPGAFVRRLAQLKKVGVVKQVDVGPKGLSEGYKPGTKNVHRDVIKDSFAHAQKTIDEAAEGTTFTLDDLLLPEFKALLVRELRLDVREPPLLNAMAAMADEGITDAFKVSPADIKRALGDEDILFQRGAAGQTDWEMEELGEGLVELTSAEIRAGRAAGEAPAGRPIVENFFTEAAISTVRRADEIPNSRDRLVYLTPDEFLRLAEPLDTPFAPKAEAIQRDMGLGEKFPDVPRLKMNEEGRIVDHDGRHRAMALRDRGVDGIPVRLESSSGAGKKDIRWNLQNQPGRNAGREYVDRLPTELIGQDGTSRIKAPYYTEGPNRGKPLPEYSGAPRAPEAPAEVMGGGLVFKMDGNTLRVQSSELPEAMRGQGIGQEMYIRALKHAQEKGFDFASDVAPSPDAIATYERLIEQGVPLTRKTVEAADGKMVQQFVATADDLADASLDVVPRAPGASAGVVETATDARVLYQEAPEGIKGATQFLEDGRSFIYALDGADFSTFVHEFGHVMRRDLGDKGMDAVTDWVKSKGVQVTHRGGRFIGDAKAVEEAEELFARGFEKYIMEGKTPQVGLKATFEKMKQWMVDIYRGVKQAEEMGEVVNLEISPALRKVFDGLLQESEPKRSLLPRTLELLRRELAGPTRSGSQVDAVAEIVSELRRTGGHDISQEDILEQIVAVQTGKKEFIELPGPVYLHGGAHGVDEAATKIGAEGRRFPTGKSKFTVEEIGQLQAEMTTSSLLLKQLATKVPMTARSQAIQEMRPSEMIDNWMAPRDSAILNLARNWMIGGDPIADMRGLKPEVRARILSGSRLVEQAIGDTAKFIEDGDFEGLFALLSGGLVRHSATGRQALSSGHDMMASAAKVINRVIDSSSGSWWSKTGPNNEALVADSVVMKGGERAYDAVAGFFDKIGGTASTRTIAELLRDPDYVHVSNALRGLISGTKKSILGDMFEAAGIDAALKNPPRDIKVMEAIFYVMGVSRRDGKKFVDTLADPESVSHSQAQVVALYTELRVVFGTDKAAVRDGAILANRIMSLVAGHGMAEKAQLRWIELGIAADENTMKAFKGWVNGEAIDNPEMLARVEQLYQVMGYGPNFQQIAMLEGITGYVPEAARRKLADALARAMDPDVTGKWTGDILEQVGGGMATGGTAWSAQRSFAFTYRYMKTRMVRGHYVLKSRYFWMNTMDHFNQMALVAGYRPAIVSTMRLLPQNILANPISQVVLTGIQKAGYEGAPEKVRSILTAAGNKGADWASTILRSSKWRVDLNDIMEAGGKDIRTGKMRPATVIIGGRVYGTLDLRQTMLEEAVFSSFDTSQLGVKIKKTANQWLERARTLEVDPQTGRAIVGERSQTIAQMLDPRTLSRISEDIAEGWAERERAGAVVTLIEMGLDPRTACRVTIEALYDYAGSMSKWDRHILMNLFFPFWAFQKNANRQILDTVFSPAGAYRLGVMRRAYTQGSEVLSSLLYQNTVDEFGLDYNNMDSTTRRQYDMMRYMLVEEYGTMDKVPLEVKQDIRGWLAGVITSRALQDGKLRALPELKNFLLKVGRLQLSDYYVAEPDAKFQRFYRQGRPGLRVPYPLQASTKKYVDLLRMEDRDAPFTTIFLPEPMYEAAFKHMGYTIASLVMAMQQLDSFAGVNLLTDEDDGTSGVSFLDPLLEVADPSRMMIVPQLAEALDIKTMAYPTALHPIIGVAAESANFDVLVLESTDDALAEISAIRDAEEAGEEPPEKAGVIRDPRYYLMPGMLQLVYSNSPLMELNRVLLQMERTPMEQRGGLRGDLVKWARSFLGLETEEVYKDRAIKFTRSAAEKEIGSKKTKEKIKKGGAVRRRDDGPRR